MDRGWDWISSVIYATIGKKQVKKDAGFMHLAKIPRWKLHARNDHWRFHEWLRLQVGHPKG